MSELPFEMVKTGNGYSNDLLATNAKYLAENAKSQLMLQHAIANLQFSQEDTTEATKKLTKVIVDLDNKNGILQNRILWLTVATVFLAVVQVIVALVK